LGMLWESYPMVWIILGFMACMVLYIHLLKRFVFRRFNNYFLFMPRPLLIFVFILTFSGGLYGHFSQYPLRWSEAFFSPHHFLSHLSLNPVLYFAETYEFSKQRTYDLDVVKKDYKLMADYLGVKDVDPEKLNFKREVKAQTPSFKPNVVLIVMESMALSKTNLMESALKPTPELEALANDSYWFSQYYSPVESTARNMFSIMTAIPDVTTQETSSRNPFVVDQRLIANSYKGYKKMYMLGGSASWANIRGIFSNNIDGVQIFEEGDYKQKRTDVWGLSDLDLFIACNDEFAKIPSDQPFFAVIQTASFHRPYTIPDNPRGFKVKQASLAELKESGFYSLDQYNSIRFADFSLGYFMNLAKKNDYYKNTIFIVTGDHGLPDEDGANVGKGAHQWNLEKYHVPLIIHNKKLFPVPTEDTRPAGHVDVMTTAAYLAGVDHINTTLGRNLFDKSLDKERYSFIYNFYSEIGEFGLLDGEFYYHFDNVKKGELFKYKTDQPDVDVKAEFPEVYNRMSDVANAYLVTARYLLMNNHK
jgi:phosphoglycerol transferase MdoB-like AlkP superfamily enzyme